MHILTFGRLGAILEMWVPSDISCMLMLPFSKSFISKSSRAMRVPGLYRSEGEEEGEEEMGGRGKWRRWEGEESGGGGRERRRW